MYLQGYVLFGKMSLKAFFVFSSLSKEVFQFWNDFLYNSTFKFVKIN